ncbi:OmpW family outer membrane protein [Amphritea sp. 1_MG-2023]|uniref:OmpW/AlkL family protein n=1 Tax=Amphritea sp. 1_MG-2023 TaxID=3062670 RepID=UPI0026E1FBEC|nr:OmpW family outer membrane protein [Amphritea sp. 1_MG-2023]MDO6563438.1 OmpW family outer membrane protein [Amphritea sp. 1_MG-2023]
MNRKALSAFVLSVSMVATANCMAYESGDMIVRVGIANVDPHTSNDTSVPGLDVDDNTQLGITGTYMLTENIGVELLAATPFKHDITLNGAKVGETKHLPPTLTLQYYPMDSSSAFQPYVGLGINYTEFFSESTTGALAGTSLELDSSWGLAGQLGIDYAIDDQWLVNAAVWKMDINTDVNVNGANLGELEIDPMVYMMSVGYKF